MSENVIKVIVRISDSIIIIIIIIDVVVGNNAVVVSYSGSAEVKGTQKVHKQ